MAVSPGSGRDVGAGRGRGIAPSFWPAYNECNGSEHVYITASSATDGTGMPGQNIPKRLPKRREYAIWNDFLTCCTCVILIVAFPPFALTSSSLSHNVRPLFTIISTPISLALPITSSSLALAYASVSFSKHKCVIPHSLINFGNTVCGASLTTSNFCFGFSAVREEERSF